MPQTRSRPRPVVLVSTMTPADVGLAVTEFSRQYKQDWTDWLAVLSDPPVPTAATVREFGRILRSWQALRAKVKGRRVRDVRDRATHPPPYLDDLFADGCGLVRRLGGLSVRTFLRDGPQHEPTLFELWDRMSALPTVGKANAVGISKAVMLLTRGAIGPALDSQVRKGTGIRKIGTARAWIDVLALLSEDLRRFEESHGPIEQFVPLEQRLAGVGRILDMVAGPRRRSGASG